MARAFKFNIEAKTMRNQNYRKVVHTDKLMQIVLMSLDVGEYIHREKHDDTTQFFRIESGEARAIVGSTTYTLKAGDCLVVPPNTWHTIIQHGRKPLKLYTIYTPPNHARKRVDKTQPEDD